MSLNLSKTKTIVFRIRGIVKETERLIYQGNGIEIVPLNNYLGVYKKSTSSNCRFQQKIGHFTPIDVFKLFDTMVKLITYYGANILGYGYSD